MKMKMNYFKTVGSIAGLLLMSFPSLTTAADDADDANNATPVGGQFTAPSADSGSGKRSTPIEGGKFATSRFKTTVSLREGYDDNVFTTHDNKVDSFFTNLAASMLANFGVGQTHFNIGLNAGVTDYYDRPGNKFDENATLSLNIVHTVNRRLTLTLNSYTTYQVEPSFDLLVSQNRQNGQYLYLQNALSAAYQWSKRFQTVTSYNLVGIFYQNSTTAQTENRLEHIFSEQFHYLLRPTTTLTSEYRLGLTQYFHQADQDRISNYFLLGFDHTFSPKFTVSLRGGAQLQSAKQGSIQVSPYVETNASYTYQRYSNVGWFLHYGFDNGGITTTNQTHQNLTTGIRINHGFTPRLGAYLGFFYQHDDFSQTPGSLTAQTEDTFDVSTGINFVVTSKLSLQLGYTRTQLLSNTPSTEYNRDVCSIGGTYTF